ncbi:hypothetical protein SBOR_3700 [Sclerotinia borealis F-4128]|uniref:N-acetyltransferase domain-containing protein n=1 Tax=Sclerotinia borealis (strain F-4128) TaxID=1432307 RepID=W9CGP4_SCLBF|nr:hypothetical protein SBOR_3700 [Sclerotinia borealis F-4128]
MTTSESSKFFTQDWTITIPTHPHLRFIRLIPSRYNHLICILSNPLNDPNNRLPTDTSWSPSDTSSLIQTFSTRYHASKTGHNALVLLIEEDAQIIGIGLMHEIEHQPRLANIGLILEEIGRSHGVGSITMQVLLRLSNELEVDKVEAGTMKGNVGMRRLMRGLGCQEVEEEKIMPGGRRVADVMFGDIERGRWRDLEIEVQFLGVVD